MISFALLLLLWQQWDIFGGHPDTIARYVAGVPQYVLDYGIQQSLSSLRIGMLTKFNSSFGLA